MAVKPDGRALAARWVSACRGGEALMCEASHPVEVRRLAHPDLLVEVEVVAVVDAGAG